jgi:Domain of unknown function (DUF4384)
MTRRSVAVLVFLLAVWSAAAQQTQPADSTHKAATEGARELFYLAVARKDSLPPIPRTSLAAGKKAGSSTAPSVTPADATPAPAPVVHLGIRYNLLLVDDANQGAAVDSERVFRKGDRLAIEVEANRSGYLYVLARQSSGSWQALLPSPEMSGESNIIDPGRKIRVPAAYYFEIQDPPGSEHLVLVFSRDPQDFYELYQGIRNQNAAPAPSSPAAAGVQLADASVVNSAVARMRQEFGTRDIAIRKVAQPLSPGEPAGSVYVVNASDKPSSSVVTEIEVRHR